MTEAEAIELFMDIWTAQVGYMEKASNADLDDPTANAGRANYTKFARDLDAVGYYNGRKQGTSWCCVGPDWSRYIAYGMELAQKIMNQPAKGCGAGVKWVYRYFDQMRHFYRGIIPQRGDQAIMVTYNAQGYVSSWQHTGVVDRVSGGRVYLIEGNTSPGTAVIPNGGMVCRKSYPLGDKRIYGYGRPRWDLIVAEMEKMEATSMKKCVATIKLKDIEKMSIVMGNGRTLAAVKRATGCDYIINGGLYCSSGPVCYLKVDGVVKSTNAWPSKGYGWSGGADITPIVMPNQLASVKNAISCVWLLGQGMTAKDKPEYPADMGGKRGRTGMALTADSLILYCTKDGSSYDATPEALQQEFAKMGATSAILLDGGGSSQCDFGGGQSVVSSRKVNNYICIWKKKKEETPMGKYTVTTKEDPLTIRKTPGGTVVGSYAKGTVVEVLEIVNGWARTAKGWCSMTFLTAVKETPTEPAQPETPTTPAVDQPEKPIAWYEVKYSGGKLNIRKGAGAGTTLVGTYTNGTVVAAYEVKNGWARTDKGWCSMQGLVKTVDPNAPDAWAKAAWDKAVAKGVLDGTRPRDAITRQELAQVLQRVGLLGEGV